MKKIIGLGLVATMLFVACENNGSSTVGTYDREESTQTETKEGHSEGTKGSEGSTGTSNATMNVDTTGATEANHGE